MGQDAVEKSSRTLSGKIRILKWIAIPLVVATGLLGEKVVSSQKLRDLLLSSSNSNNEMWIPQTRARNCPSKPFGEVKSFRRSQFGEDWDLYVAFDGMCNGSYIEMGALDGIRYSNSHLFQQAFGYKGLLVELNPEKYRQAVANRPHELAVANAAVCSDSQQLHWVDAHGTGATNGIWEFASEEYRQRNWKHIDPDISKLPTVPCVPLTELMDQYLKNQTRVATMVNGIPHYYFDFYSLDVEGAEWSVLQSIDWSRTAFGLLLLEKSRDEPAAHEKIINFLTQEQGYTLYKDGHRNSFWFKHRDFDQIYSGVLPPATLTAES